MKKTASQIERDLFVLLAPFAAKLRGRLYRSGMRPPNSKDEDAVLFFVAGSDEQMQEGFVRLNIYVPDRISDGRSVPDHSRIAQLEADLLEWVDSLTPEEYAICTDPTPSTLPPEGDEHFRIIAARLRYRRLS